MHIQGISAGTLVLMSKITHSSKCTDDGCILFRIQRLPLIIILLIWHNIRAEKVPLNNITSQTSLVLVTYWYLPVFSPPLRMLATQASIAVRWSPSGCIQVMGKWEDKQRRKVSGRNSRIVRGWGGKWSLLHKNYQHATGITFHDTAFIYFVLFASVLVRTRSNFTDWTGTWLVVGMCSLWEGRQLATT
jgi:hypothetical protein